MSPERCCPGGSQSALGKESKVSFWLPNTPRLRWLPYTFYFLCVILFSEEIVWFESTKNVRAPNPQRTTSAYCLEMLERLVFWYKFISPTKQSTRIVGQHHYDVERRVYYTVVGSMLPRWRRMKMQSIDHHWTIGPNHGNHGMPRLRQTKRFYAVWLQCIPRTKCTGTYRKMPTEKAKKHLTPSDLQWFTREFISLSLSFGVVQVLQQCNGERDRAPSVAWQGRARSPWRCSLL